jgi:hypothetical protein
MATLLGIGLGGGTDVGARGVQGDRPALSAGCFCCAPGARPTGRDPLCGRCWATLLTTAGDCRRQPCRRQPCWRLPATTLLAAAGDDHAGKLSSRLCLSGMGCLAVWRSGGLAVWLCSACALACQSVSRTLDTPVTAWFYQGGGARWRVPGEIPPPVAPAVSFRVVVQSGRYSGRLCFLPVHHVSVRWRVSVCLQPV